MSLRSLEKIRFERIFEKELQYIISQFGRSYEIAGLKSFPGIFIFIEVACGRLFEGVAKSQGKTHIPPEITNLLGKSPHEWFQAGMQLLNYSQKGQEKSEIKEKVNKQSIEF